MMVVPTLRPAVFPDQRQLSGLLTCPYVHRHLDWREPLSWIGSAPFLVLAQGEALTGALACPVDATGVAWLRFFAVSAAGEVEQAWSLLWQAAGVQLASTTASLAAAIALQGWMVPLLEAGGFSTHQQLVMLERSDENRSEPFSTDRGTSREFPALRDMLIHDLPGVAEVDAAAFMPLWQNSLDDLRRAHARAAFSTVCEVQGRIVAYQISTRNAHGVHLARLAVVPEVQGQGIGQALVRHLFAQAEPHGVHRFTVNTQSDNAISLVIYKRLGFVETGERYPVYENPLSHRRLQDD